jgi:hypothetical protein
MMRTLGCGSWRIAESDKRQAPEKGSSMLLNSWHEQHIRQKKLQ